MTTTAQTTSTPGVRVVRNLPLNDRVWPADLNRDGITDLVSTAPGTSRVQVSLGRGDGTFAEAVASGFVGFALGVGDFNNDGRADVIAASYASNSGNTIALLPGTGSAALGAAVPVATMYLDEFAFAVSADLNGDGTRDLVLPGPTIYPGNGDFTFDAPVSLAGDKVPADALIVDVNGDGRRDIAAANAYGGSVTVFLNHGGFVFGALDTPLGMQANDVTAADVDGNGRVDLLVSAGRADSIYGFGDGAVFVLRGNGDGTFQLPVRYDVPHGPMQIVAVDWNKDGLIDIATGNQSTITRDDCADFRKTWDSVSILLNTGGGTFSGPSNFSVGDQRVVDFSDPNYERYKLTLRSLNTSDLNRDGRVDLIASFGAIVFNVPPVANRPPTVDFGPDLTVQNTHEVILRPRASDPDQDMLTWEIRDDGGRVFATYTNACFQELHDGPNRFTVTVNDGHGHTATDSLLITVQSGEGGTGPLATGQDIGAVAAAGTDTYNSDTGRYTIQGSGADIWGTADEFHFVSAQFTGDFAISARVDSVQNIQAWTKGGLMIRENLTPGSRHASVFATPGKGLAFQRRTTANGVSVSTSGPMVAAPLDLQISRRGNTVSAYWRRDIDQPWTLIARQTFTSLPQTLYAGLAVTSHQDGTLARGEFSNIVVHQTAWAGQAIGSATGSATDDGVVYKVNGRGADIWGTADAFYYVYTRVSGRFSLTARVDSVTAINAWTKAGVMIRESLSPGARHAFALVSASKGMSLQYRPTTGGVSVQAANSAAAAPLWLRIFRLGDQIYANWSNNGYLWQQIGSVTLPMNDEVFVGLPVTSHDPSATATGVFESVELSTMP